MSFGAVGPTSNIVSMNRLPAFVCYLFFIQATKLHLFYIELFNSGVPECRTDSTGAQVSENAVSLP